MPSPGNKGNKPAQILVAPKSFTLRVGESVELTATPADAEGAAAGKPGAVEWGLSSSDGADGELTGTATRRRTLVATQPGWIVVDATSRGVTGYASGQILPAVVVEPPPPVEPPPVPPVEPPPPPPVEPPPPPVVDPTPAPVPPVPPTPGVPADLAALLGGPVAPVSAAASLPEPLRSAVAAYDAMFATYADIYWQRNGADWQADFGNYYDRALAYYAMWQRTGRAEYAERGDAHAVNYRDRYLVPATPPYGASAHWAQFRGLAIHAVRASGIAVSGTFPEVLAALVDMPAEEKAALAEAETPEAKAAADAEARAALVVLAEKSRTAVVRMADGLAQVLPEFYTPGGGDLRILARQIDGSLLARRLTKNGTDLPPDTWPRDWDAQLDKLLAAAAAWEEDGSDPTRGIYPVAVSCWTTMNYQLALLLDALTAAHDLYRPDPAIVAQVRRAADWLWTTQWKGTGFQYLSGSCPNVGGTEIASDLTGMFVDVWGWLAKQTGDAKYRAQGDAMFVAAVAGAYPQGGKQFNEMFSTSWRYLGRR